MFCCYANWTFVATPPDSPSNAVENLKDVFTLFSLIPLVLSIKDGCDWQFCWPYWARAKQICHLTLISKGESEDRGTLSNILGWLMSCCSPLSQQMRFISSEKRKQGKRPAGVLLIYYIPLSPFIFFLLVKISGKTLDLLLKPGRRQQD